MPDRIIWTRYDPSGLSRPTTKLRGPSKWEFMSTCRGRALNASPSEGMPQHRSGVFSVGVEGRDASLAQDRRDIFGREKGAQQHFSCRAVENDALPNQRLVFELRVVVEEGVRDLARERTDERLEIDALHHRFRVATLGR